MIRIIKLKQPYPEGRRVPCFYSLSDLVKFLGSKWLLTDKQQQRFYIRVQKHMLQRAVAAHKADLILESDEPLIFGVNEWFIHYIKWETFFAWLPPRVQNIYEVRKIFREIDYNEGILYPEEYMMFFSEHEIVIPAPDYTIKQRPAKEDIPEWNPFRRDGNKPNTRHASQSK